MTVRASWPWGEAEGWTELPSYPGGDFLIRRTVRGDDELPAGFILAHLHTDGTWCVGSVPRKGIRGRAGRMGCRLGGATDAVSVDPSAGLRPARLDPERRVGERLMARGNSREKSSVLDATLTIRP